MMGFVSLVTGLFTMSSPSTILRSVRAIIVNSINTVLWRRPLSHICNKLTKIMEPCITYRDTPRSIVQITAFLGIIASAFHAPPDLVFWCPASPSCCSMRKRLHRPNIDSETPTRFRVPSSEVSHRNADYTPCTITDTCPDGLVTLGVVTKPVQCYQTAKSNTRNINSLHGTRW